MKSIKRKYWRLKRISTKDDEIDSKLYELRALRNRARKRRINGEFELARELYLQALEVAKKLKSKEEVVNLEKIVDKIDIDLMLQSLARIERELENLTRNF